MDRYFKGLIRQTDLTIETAPPIGALSADREQLPLSSLESERRFMIDPPPNPVPEQAGPGPAEPNPRDASGQTAAGFKAQPLRPADVEHVQRELDEPARTPESPGSVSSSPIDHLASSESELEAHASVGTTASEAADDVAGKERSQASELHGTVEYASPSLVPPAAEKAHRPAERQPPRNLTDDPETSPAQQVVRNLLDWIGEEAPEANVHEDAESTLPILPTPPDQTGDIQHPVPGGVEPAVVEQQQSLHLSIGSIVMTLEGSPNEVETQPRPRRQERPVRAEPTEPLLRLSRHYLRIR